MENMRKSIPSTENDMVRRSLVVKKHKESQCAWHAVKVRESHEGKDGQITFCGTV